MWELSIKQLDWSAVRVNLLIKQTREEANRTIHDAGGGGGISEEAEGNGGGEFEGWSRVVGGGNGTGTGTGASYCSSRQK